MKIYIIKFGFAYEVSSIYPQYFLTKEAAEARVVELKKMEEYEYTDYFLVRELVPAIDNEYRNLYDGMTDAELAC